MSKTIVKILDASLFPAALMITAKFIGLYIVLNVFNIDWGIENTADAFISSRPVVMGDDIQFVSSYSDLFLLVIMTFGFSFYVIRAVFFHTSHINPTLLSRLAINGLLGLVKDSFEVYRKASVWLLFVWITNITILINTVFGRTYEWVLIVGLVISTTLTIILLRDVAYEIQLAQNNLKKAY